MHNLEAALRLPLYSIAEFSVVAPASLEEHSRAYEVMEALLRPGRPPVRFLYRGDSQENLRASLFGAGEESLPDDILYSRLFYFGQKSRHFSVDSKRAVARREWLRSVCDTSPATFGWIFKNIARVLRFRDHRVRRFREADSEFTRYFLDPNNEGGFLQLGEGLSEADRQSVRDYYLYFLHTVGRRGINKASLLVSASTDIAVARRFAGAGVVMYLFEPNPASRFTVGAHDVPGASWLPAQAPRYVDGTSLYPEQEEHGFRAAVFPQMIFGLHDLLENRFILNPHLLSAEQAAVSIRRSGIRLDQSKFEESIAGTGFVRYAERNPEGYYRENFIRRHPSSPRLR